MKPFTYFTCLFTILLLSSPNLFAQDYVITQKGDTIFCKLKWDFLKSHYKYKSNPKDDYHFVNDTAVVEFYVAKDSTHWVLRTIPNGDYLADVVLLERGKINLYRYILSYSTRETETFWYASKGNDNLIQIKHFSLSITGFTHSQKTEKKAFLDLVSDKPTLMDKLTLNHFDIENIHNYIKMYNTTE